MNRTLKRFTSHGRTFTRSECEMLSQIRNDLHNLSTVVKSLQNSNKALQNELAQSVKNNIKYNDALNTLLVKLSQI